MAYSARNIERFKMTELRMDVSQSGSWHNSTDSAYIYIGNLHYGMNEGDIVIVFSEFGEVVDIRLARDKETGKPKGFAFLAYQDRRSTALAVDNFNRAIICGRPLKVDHVSKFKPPAEFMRLSKEIKADCFRPTGPDGRGWGKYREHTNEEMQKLQAYRKDKALKTEHLRVSAGLVDNTGHK